jgi:hypothetical protein
VDDHRQAADAVARLLGDQRGTETILALRQLAEDSRAAGARAARPREPDARPRYAGVWEIVDTQAGPGLRRRPRIPLWEACVWSAERDIPGQGEAIRVVLTGESVARGYLLDPVLNPAAALRQYLSAAPAGPQYQCVDLAQTSIRLPHLRHVMDTAARHLDADVLVVFAGNNWTTSSDDVPATDYPPSLADTLRSQGYPGLRRQIQDEVLLPQVRDLLGDLERLREETGTRPIVVVPEFNLTGWSPLAGAKEMDVPMLPEAALERWYELRSSAIAAGKSGDWAAVRSAAGEMSELDEGMSPVPGYLLGQALAAAGEPEAAREAYERSRDAMFGLTVRYLPRAPRVVQDMMRDSCRRAGIDCVDLPRLLGRPGTPALPDPAHFLDYCHLSDSGIAIAMSAVARLITGPSGDSPAPAGPPAPLIGSWDRAVSLVLAAAYNSFCGQPADVVRAYLRRAVDDCPRITGLLASLRRVLDRPGGPLWSGPDFAEVTREPNVATIFVRLGEYRPDKSRLWTLREGLAAELAGAATGATAGPLTAGPDSGGADSGADGARRELLDISTTMLGLGNVPNYTRPRCYLQANTPVTEIKLLLAAPACAVLRLTHRRREGRAQPAPVRLNGQPLGELPAAPGWHRTDLAITAGLTQAGMNLIEVIWPGPAVGWQTRLDDDASALARGEQPYVLPIFGELYSVTWCPGRDQDAPVSGPGAPAAVAASGGRP